MRILALDWGTKRIGAAISDEEGKIAFPLEQVFDPKTFFSDLAMVFEEKKIEKILLGNPKTLAGEKGASAREVEKLKTRLEQTLPVEVELVDERLTSVQAGKILKEQGISEKKQRSFKDNLAAQLMLQQYLDTRPLTPKRSDGERAK